MASKYKVSPVNVDNYVESYLTLNGDGSTRDMNVNGSVTPQKFWYRVPTDKRFDFENLVVIIENAGSGFTWQKFGNLAALTNGFKLEIYKPNNTVLRHSLFPQGEAKDNRDFLALCGVDFRFATEGTQLLAIEVHYQGKTGGGGLEVLAGEYIRATVQDDLSTLDQLRVAVSGELEGPR